MGVNLICIHSKKYMSQYSAEARNQKLRDNRQAIMELTTLLEEGGKLIWLAPAGGRDRDTSRITPFGDKNLQLFEKLAQNVRTGKSGRISYFAPLSMKTHGLIPPPTDTGLGLGEPRYALKSGISLYFGSPQVSADHLEDVVQKNYVKLLGM